MPQPCGEDESFYPNAIRSLQQTVFNTDIPPHTTWRDTDVSYFNLGHLSCPSGGPSGGDIRPDSTVSSEASNDLYFDVSYAGQLAVPVDKFDVSSSHTKKQELCQTDAVLLANHFAWRQSETEMTPFCRRSTESVCSEKNGEHFSLTDTRPDSLTASEASDELYFDVSYVGQPTNSCVQGGTDSLSSSCSSQFRHESSDYINCSDLF